MILFFDLYKKFEKRHIKIEKNEEKQKLFCKNEFKNGKRVKKHDFTLAKSFNRM